MDELDCAEIASPCRVAWDGMVGDGRVRHCGQCRQNVYNIAALGRREAVQLISAHQGRLCLRIFRRTDGTIVTADCWSRLRAARRKGIWAFVAMLLVVAWAELAAMFVGLQGLRKLDSDQVGGGHIDELEGSRTMGLVQPPSRIIPPGPAAPQEPGAPAPGKPTARKKNRAPHSDEGSELMGKIAPPSHERTHPARTRTAPDRD